MERIRIQKYLSQRNILSRRKAEEYLVKGWITVNGKVVTQLGTTIDPEWDRVQVNPPIETSQNRYRYIVFYKPKGVVSNLPAPGERQITDLLPKSLRHLSTIGRLDKDSEGLILLTDDGVFAKKMLSSDHERAYVVRANAPITDSMIERIEDGMIILGSETQRVYVNRIDQQTIEMRLWEGRNRQIRRMLAKLGLVVVRLKRISYGPLTLGDLQKGEFREIDASVYPF
ncbi:rRNA pseudouridine synthase [bacterium]|nr:rRNA pseudouridine synthase [bacterium]